MRVRSRTSGGGFHRTAPGVHARILKEGMRHREPSRRPAAVALLAAALAFAAGCRGKAEPVAWLLVEPRTCSSPPASPRMEVA